MLHSCKPDDCTPVLLPRPKARKCATQHNSIKLCVCKWAFVRQVQAKQRVFMWVWFRGIMLLFSGCNRAVFKHHFLLLMPPATCCPWKKSPSQLCWCKVKHTSMGPGLLWNRCYPCTLTLRPILPHTLNPTQIYCQWQHCVGLRSDQIHMTDYTDFTLTTVNASGCRTILCILNMTD